MRRMMLTVAAVAMLVLAGPAGAQDGAINVPIGTVVRAPQGSITELASAPVDPELQGRSCTGEAVAENQDSVHPDNNLIIATGTEEVVIPNVEGSPDEIDLISEPFVLGETITVSLQMGPDEVFSGGFLGLVVDCQLPPPTTTTSTTTTTTATSTTTTTTIATTTTVPPTTAPPTVPLTTSSPTTVAPPPTMPATGAGDSDRPLLGGLLLVTAGATLLVGVEVVRRRSAGRSG